MKILQVTNFFKPSWEAGGPARVAYDISKNLVDRGHDVTVYTTDGFKYRLNVGKNKCVDVDGIKTYYFRNLSSYLSKTFVLPIPYHLPVIASKQLKHFDIVHLHEYRTFSAIMIHHFSKKYNVPYVLQAHGSCPKIVKRKKLKMIFDILFGKQILKDASKLFALNKTEVEQYIALGADINKIEIVPNGIDETKYEKLPPKGSFKKKYFLEKFSIILYVGRLHISKGVDLLIESFKEVVKEYNDARLVIIGPDDGYEDYYKQLVNKLEIKEKVIFTGFISITEKTSAYVDADIFVTPWFSGFPITFLESCVCGTPIITTTKGDKLEWIEENVGLVVSYNKDILAETMIRLLFDKELKARLQKNCKHVVNENFTLNKVVTKLEKVYLSCLSENPEIV